MRERHLTDEEINEMGDKVAERGTVLFDNIEEIDTLIVNKRMVKTPNIVSYQDRCMYFTVLSQYILKELGTLFSKTRPSILRRVVGLNEKQKQKIQKASEEYIASCKDAIRTINAMIKEVDNIYVSLNTPSDINPEVSEVSEESEGNNNERAYLHNYSDPPDAIGTLSQETPPVNKDDNYDITAGGKKSNKRRTRSKQTKQRQRKINKKSKIKYTIRRR